MKCEKCGSKNFKKNGFKKVKDGSYQKFECKECGYPPRDNQKFIKQETKSIKDKLHIEEINILQEKHNLSLREIARIKKVALSTLQYFIEHNKK